LPAELDSSDQEWYERLMKPFYTEKGGSSDCYMGDQEWLESSSDEPDEDDMSDYDEYKFQEVDDWIELDEDWSVEGDEDNMSDEYEAKAEEDENMTREVENKSADLCHQELVPEKDDVDLGDMWDEYGQPNMTRNSGQSFIIDKCICSCLSNIRDYRW
jgi:hypothetical protein